MFHWISHRLRPALGAAFLGGLSFVGAEAAVRLHPIFTDHAVLQHGKPVPVWGWADPGEKVTVRFGGQSVSAEANAQGKWIAHLKPLKATAAPRALEASGTTSAKV